MMMATRRVPKDVRSTGRKRARKKLFLAGVPYECNVCKVSGTKLPPDCPLFFKNWPVGKRTYRWTLQANHINKVLLDVDLSNLEWLCIPCHKKKDLTSAKGVSVIEDEFGYDFD